ncbi:hypothetical protein K490DRAFT_10156, partial [Saccharata proteae CBS 121410]
MASAQTSPPNVVAPDEDQDPFVSPTPSHDSRRQRYAAFDNNVFSIYSEGSPAQAKRAIQAHLAETERRLQEASHLGQQLVAQRTALQSRMEEVARQQDANEIEPQLRAKLIELEREFNEVGKDTARAFIPKGRVPSTQFPAEPDPTSTVLSSEAQPSPSKLNVPSSRKQRNQQPHRIHDIKLATEISSSLLNQVRELQAALAEKDEALKTVMAERSRLEYDVEGLTQRLRAMDESEQRYKDENWNLETKNQELLTTLKEAGNKEVRLTQNLTTAKEDKATVERELEELKQSHTKLQDDHHTTRKHHEAEIISLRRNVQNGETEKSKLVKKVDELTYQNQELARGLTYTQRMAEQAAARSPAKGFDDDDSGNSTPDDSPEPSPNKATPRHGQLESETLKSSLQHAHRMIQNLKNNIHREKTEKMEMRRLLQEARDDLETARKENVNGVSSAVKKRRQNEKQELFKKPPRPDRLGMPRAGRDEIIMDEGDWEDNDEHDVPETPSRRPVTAVISPGVGRIPSGPVRQPIWSTENSDAFETANERDTTESDDFQTGAETIEGESSDELTETEGHLLSPPNANRTRRASPLSLLKNGDRDSYLSTASNSGDEFDSEMEAKTPIQRYRLKITRDGTRKTASGRNSLLSRDSNDTRESTADITSDREEAEGGKSLLAELGDFSGADSDEVSTAPNTPSRHSLRSIHSRSTVLSPSPLSSPEQLRRSATKSLAGSTSSGQTFVPGEKIPMVSSGMMTEPWEPESKGVIASATEAAGAAVAGAVGGFGLAKAGQEDSATAENSLVVAKGLETVPVEQVVVPQQLGISPVTGQNVDPVEPETVRPALDISPVKGQFVDPIGVLVHHLYQLGTRRGAKAGAEEDSCRPGAQAGSLLHLISSVGAGRRASSSPEDGARTLPAIILDLRPAVRARGASGSCSQTRSRPLYPNAANILDFCPRVRACRSSGSQAPSFSPVGYRCAGHRTGGSCRAGEVTEEAERRSSGDKSPITPSEQSALPGTDAARPGSAFFGTIAEEQPSQKRLRSRSARPDSETIPTGRTPFAPIAENVAHVDRNRIADEGTQTMVSSEDIDGLLASKQFPVTAARPSSPTKFATSVPNRVSRSPLETSPTRTPKRPGSAHSTRSRTSQSQPPLPSDHKEVIAAASQRVAPGSMGPPTTSASTLRNQNSFNASQPSRPKTPVEGGRLARDGSPVRKDGTTPRPKHAATRSELSSPTFSRRTSVNSFQSELEQRFNIPLNPIPRPQGSGEADPRMIKAVTDVMMGEYLWKYTRKAGREKFSENRHLRYFWVHPFTRTLYWSDSKPRDPLNSKSETKAKSVPIDEILLEEDDNLFPPGLHQKSITVVAPGRSIKFTAATSKTHETWFNALSYLLMRTDDEGEDGKEAQINTEDVLDFNPSYDPRSNSRQTARSRASLSSYNSRTTRTSSPHRSSHVPSLARHAGGTQGRSTPVNQGSMSNRLATLTGLFRPPSGMRGSMSSKRSKHSVQEGGGSIYDASVVQESAEDLGDASGEAEGDGERLENVRACCDGKHDVGSLSHKGRHGHHHH